MNFSSWTRYEELVSIQQRSHELRTTNELFLMNIIWGDFYSIGLLYLLNIHRWISKWGMKIAWDRLFFLHPCVATSSHKVGRCCRRSFHNIVSGASLTITETRISKSGSSKNQNTLMGNFWRDGWMMHIRNPSLHLNLSNPTPFLNKGSRVPKKMLHH